MSGRVIPAAVNWAALLKQTAPADRKLMAAFKLKVSLKIKRILFYFFSIKSDAIAANYNKAASFKREIDWDSYANSIAKEGFVADFKVRKRIKVIRVNKWE